VLMSLGLSCPRKTSSVMGPARWLAAAPATPAATCGATRALPSEATCRAATLQSRRTSYNVQGVSDINTKEMTHTLNFYLKVQWRDWRLAYTEAGPTCWNSVSTIGLDGQAGTVANDPTRPVTTNLTTLQQMLYATVLDAWGCTTARAAGCANCPTAPTAGLSPGKLPFDYVIRTQQCFPNLVKGVLPTVNVSYGVGNSSLVITFWPAPNYLYAPGGPYAPDGTTISVNGINPQRQLYFPLTPVSTSESPTANQGYAYPGIVPINQPPEFTSCFARPCTSQEQFFTLIFDTLNNSPFNDAALTGAQDCTRGSVSCSGTSANPINALDTPFLSFFTKSNQLCSGIRRTSGYMILGAQDGNRQADTSPSLGNSIYGDYRHPHLPAIANPEAFWNPFMFDSINQVRTRFTFSGITSPWLTYPRAGGG